MNEQKWIAQEKDIIDNCYKAKNRQSIPDSVTWSREVLNKNTEEQEVIEWLNFRRE